MCLGTEVQGFLGGEMKGYLEGSVAGWQEDQCMGSHSEVLTPVAFSPLLLDVHDLCWLLFQWLPLCFLSFCPCSALEHCATICMFGFCYGTTCLMDRIGFPVSLLTPDPFSAAAADIFCLCPCSPMLMGMGGLILGLASLNKFACEWWVRGQISPNEWTLQKYWFLNSVRALTDAYNLRCE